MTQQVRHYGSYTAARTHLRAVLDAASAGYVTTVDREDDRFLVSEATTFRAQLADLRPSQAQVIPEGGGWAVIIPGLPVHGDADTFDAAIDDAIDALREYAEDWNDRLRLAANHAQHRFIVALIELSDDDELRSWLLGTARTSTDNAHLTAE